jgi:peptidoglycan-associated lipoprotein
VAISATLALGGCSSKKPAAVPGAGGAGGIGENGLGGAGGSSMGKMQSGTLGSADQGPLSDIHFGYNQYTIAPDESDALKANAKWLADNPNSRVQIEGHCDERGSEDYNIALGAKRSQAGREYLTTLGVVASRISTISYGKELPLCQEHDESCWSRNRRDHFAVQQ